MKPTDITEFAALMAGIGELYGKPLSELFTEFYWEALKSFDIVTIRQALYYHIRHPRQGRFFPTIADIICHIEGESNHLSLQAWAKVKKAIQRIGDWPSVVFDDPLIHVVIQEMGGWVKINQLTIYQEPHVQREFETHYRAYQKLTSFKYPAQLKGRCEGVTAYQPPEGRQPLLLGDIQKAKQVFANGNLSSSQEGNCLNLPSYQQHDDENN